MHQEFLVFLFQVQQPTHKVRKRTMHGIMYKLMKIGMRLMLLWDDPIITGGGELTQELKYKYFLKGSTEFNVDHKEDGRLSENGKQFRFPTISAQNYRL